MFKILSEIWENKNYIVPKENLLRSPLSDNKYAGVEEIDLTKLEVNDQELIYKNIYHFNLNSSKNIDNTYLELENENFKVHIQKTLL